MHHPAVKQRFDMRVRHGGAPAKPGHAVAVPQLVPITHDRILSPRCIYLRDLYPDSVADRCAGHHTQLYRPDGQWRPPAIHTHIRFTSGGSSS